ncbi:MAG: lipoprotein [Rhizobiaceae bacterium]
MSAQISSFGRTIVLMLAVAIALAGCGRRGALEPPPSARVLETDETGAVTAPPPASERRIFLDPLLD